MKVGDYVRTKNGNIRKIEEVINKDYIDDPDYYVDKVLINKVQDISGSSIDFEDWLFEEDIIKSSSNIIDLIEVGDYVNGLKVIQMYSPEGKYTLWIKLSDNTFIDNSEEIKSIATKEQFKNIEYEVE